MAAKKKSAKNVAPKFDATKGDVAAHIEKDVNAAFANAKNTWSIMRGYVELNAQGKLPASKAKDLLIARRNALIAKYRANDDPRDVASIKDSRVSEMAGILRLGEWKCWPTAFAHIKDLDVNTDTVNTLSKVVRKAVKGKELKDSASSCPSREVVLAAIKKRKAQRRDGNGGNGRDLTASTAETAIENMIEKLAKIGKWFGKDGREMANAMIKDAKSMLASAKKVAKERAKAEAAAEAA